MTVKESKRREEVNPEYSIGLGKTIFNSSVAAIPVTDWRKAEIAISERFNRIKNSGAWPEKALGLMMPILIGKILEISENRDVQSTLEFENYVDSRFPLRERLRSLGLNAFSTMESAITLVSHHEAHAYAALLFSPFDECLVLILDGAGTKFEEGYEYLSLFRWKNRKLQLLDKKYLLFTPSDIPGQSFCEGIGIFYEKISEFIFNNKTEAGKVMGLAPYGKSSGIVSDYPAFLESLDWDKQYRGNSKSEWQSSPHQDYYRNLAATVQENFEFYLMNYLMEVNQRFPDENLILTGGCALNCTFNGKLIERKLFRKIFIPPNPGDEGIGLGCAASWLFRNKSELWSPTSWDELSSSKGLVSSVPDEEVVSNTFEEFEVSKPGDLIHKVASLLHQGEIIAWIQGRSECGPRSLGNRSMLASPLRQNVKSYLNENIKFREDFRPYGCTVIKEEAHKFFETGDDFESPFMSFAVKVRPVHADKLKSVSHVDGTSRIQTLHQKQDKKFHSLLVETGKISGIPILLNTSLNVMNEPIVETAGDALRFFSQSKVRIMVLGDFLIRKKGNSHV